MTIRKLIVIALAIHSFNVYSVEVELPIDIVLFEKQHEITAYLDDTNENLWSVNSQELLSLLTQNVDATRLDTIRQQLSDKKVNQYHFDQLGWQSHYSVDDLKLTVSLPVTEKKVIDLQMTPLYSGTPPPTVTQISPHFVSGIINANLTHNQNLLNDRYSSSYLSLRSSLAIGSVTLEDTHSYGYSYLSNQGQWQRNTTRLMYDLPNDNGFLQFGDYYTQTDIQSLSGEDLFGLSYSYQPRYLALGSRPNSVPVRLDNASLVTINVNGEPYKVLRLAAGQYNLRDLPLEQGINEVEVIYQDRNGSEQRHFYNLIDSPNLLLPGDIEMQWVAGVVQGYDEKGIKRLYQDQFGSQAVFSYGLTDWWTLSPLIEWQDEYQRYQVRNNFSIGDNFLSFTSSQTRAFNNRTNQGTLQFYAPSAFYDKLSSLSLLYTITDSNIENSSTYHTISFSSGIKAPIDNGYLSFTLSQSFNEHETINKSASINSSYRWFNKLNTSFNVRWNEQYNKSNTTFYFSFSLPLSWNNLSIYSRSSYNSDDDVYNNSISTSQYKRDYYWRAGANFVNSTFEGIDSYGRFYGDNLDFSAGFYSSNENSQYKNRQVSLGLDTAIAWAGSDMFWTSPVYGSFSVVKLPEYLQDKYALEKDNFGKVKIIPKQDSQNGKSKQLLEIGNNSYRTIRIDGSELDFNEELTTSQLAALSKRRTGSSYEIDITKGYFVTGSFHNQNNQPIEDLVGEFQRANSSQTYPFFTGADGGFELDVLPPGDYRVYFYDGKAEEMFVSIKEAHVIEDTFIELGQLNIRTY